MLSENIEKLLKKERLEAQQIGFQRGYAESRLETMREIAHNLIAMNLLTDAQIAQATTLKESEVTALREALEAHDETAYLLRSKKNASRLLASIAEFEADKT